MLLAVRGADDGMRRVRRRGAVRVAFIDQSSRMIVVRRRRAFAGKAVAGADKRDHAGNDGADQRQRDDGFVHAA